MRCWKCGAELPDGARFCYMCAAPVSDGDAEERVREQEGAEGAGSEAPEEDAQAAEPEVADDGGSDGGAAPEGPCEEAPAQVDGTPAGEVGGDAAARAEEEADEPDELVAEAAAPDEEPAEQFADPAPMPAVRKLESPLPVGAVPFVPMAPSPRSTYVQRRSPRPVRSSRPGSNSAPTVASGYTNLGWAPGASPQQEAPAAPAAEEQQQAQPGDTFAAGFKSKFNQALESWTASAAARDEKKREARAAAERVEAAGREQRAREERARREEAERAELERQAREEEAALAARVREEARAAEAAAARVEAEAAAPDADRTVVAAPAAGPAAQPSEGLPAFRADDVLAARRAARERENDVTAFWEAEPASAAAQGQASPESTAPHAAPAPAPGDAYEEESTRDLGAGIYGVHPAKRPANKTNFPKKPLLIGIAAVFVAVCCVAAATIFAPREEAETPVLKPSEQVAPITSDEPAAEPEPEDANAPAVRDAVDDYSWDELSQISALIAEASSDADGMAIAEKYHLCSASGKLDGTQAKSVQLGDGTTVKMRVAGFRCDDRADGSGKAGITFLCDTAVAARPVNASGAVDWSASDLRAWLDSEGAALLPDELSQKIVSVKKVANLVSDPASQETVEEGLWIPSYSEVAGELTSGSVRYGAYNAEGAQYQLFSDQGCTWDAPSDAFKVQGECANWWTRSADPTNSGLFIAPRNSDGAPGFARNAAISGEVGVVPGFCI